MKSRHIPIYEGVGGASLVGFLYTALNSFSLYINYRSFINSKFVPVNSIENYIDQKIHIEGTAYSSHKDILHNEYEYEQAYFDTGNKKIMNFSGSFYLDPGQQIKVTPDQDTKWFSFSSEKIQKISIFRAVLTVLTTPLVFFRYFLGIRISVRKTERVHKIESGSSIFVSGTVLSSNEIVPDFISPNRYSVELSLLSSFKSSLIFPLFFLTLAYVSYYLVKRLEKEGGMSKKIIAVSDMKCVGCKTENCSVMFSDCNHLCLCQDCERDNDTCPLCGTYKTGIVRVYTG